MFTHIGKRKGIDYPCESMIDLMNENRVEKAVICCMLENIDNEYTRDSYRKFTERFIPCAVINPWLMDAEEELEKCFHDYGFYGVKFSATRYNFSADREGLLDPLFELCRKYRKFVIVHGIADLFSMPDKWAIMAERFPDVPLLLNHIGVATMGERAITLAKRIPNFYLSTAVAYAPLLEKAIRELNGEKIVFSSDSPYASMMEEIEKVEFCCKDEKTKNKLFCQNALKILNRE